MLYIFLYILFIVLIISGSTYLLNKYIINMPNLFNYKSEDTLVDSSLSDNSQSKDTLA
jgi:hypothetical protein